MNRRELFQQYGSACIGICLPWTNLLQQKRRCLLFYDFTQPDKYTGYPDCGGVGPRKSPDGMCRQLIAYCFNLDVGYKLEVNETYNQLNNFKHFRYPACIHIYDNYILLSYKNGRKLKIAYSSIEKWPYAPRCNKCGCTDCKGGCA